jgi:hypothetical protein
MKTVLLVVLLLPLYWAERLTNDVPLFVWSGESYLNGQNKGVPDSFESEELYNVLSSFINNEKPSVLKDYILTTESKPEIIVLFLEEKLRRDQIALMNLSTLSRLMETEKSSLYAPFVDFQTDFNTYIVNLAYDFSKKGSNVIYVGRGSNLLQNVKTRIPEVFVVKNDEFEENVGNYFTNGLTDLLIIDIHSFKDPLKHLNSDSIISDVHSFISKKTSKYIAFYTGLSYDDPQFTLTFGKIQSKRGLFAPAPNGTNGTTPNGSNGTIPNVTNGTDNFYTYFPGWFWEVFVFVLVVLPTAIGGIYAIDGIQTPEVFFVDDKKKTS